MLCDLFSPSHGGRAGEGELIDRGVVKSAVEMGRRAVDVGCSISSGKKSYDMHRGFKSRGLRREEGLRRHGEAIGVIVK